MPTAHFEATERVVEASRALIVLWRGMAADARTTERRRRLEDSVGRALVGKPDVVRLAVVGLLARGHLLIEDVPGVGKTTLGAALARSIGGGVVPRPARSRTL